jgi:hypothetical protein
LANDLVFRDPPAEGPPTVLVFGQPETSDTYAYASGALVLPAFTLAGDASATLPPSAYAAGDLGALPVFALAGASIYNSATERPLVGRFGANWERADDLQKSAVSRWQAARRIGSQFAARHQRADGLQSRFAVPWSESGRLRAGAGSAWQEAAQLRAGLRLVWEESLRLRSGARSGWQEAERLPVVGWNVRYQNGLPVRLGMHAVWQEGQRVELTRRERVRSALNLRRSWNVRWQDGIHPPSGAVVVVEPPYDPCYIPSTQLVFQAGPAADNRLVFICERHATPPPGTAPLFIPLLRFYMSTHHLEAVLLPSLERVPLTDVVIEADASMPHWRLSASGPLGILEQFGMTGTPKLMRVTVDGLPWVFAIEGRGRSRVPGERRARLTGRSVPALLGSSRLPSQTWLNSAPISAAQIVADALQFTDVDVDWQISDWLVPAGAWSFKGKPLAAAVRVAEAVGAVVQSHPTAPQLIYSPRYKLMPWEWDAVTTVPDVSVSSFAIATDDLEIDEQPEWNAVYVFGTAQGVARHVVRSGTAGEVVAEQVTDDLITAHEAAVERGRSVLGAGGIQAQMSISLPILTGGSLPGVLRVNQLLEVVEPSETWRGLVRAVSVRAGMEEVRQSLRVERHFL